MWSTSIKPSYTKSLYNLSKKTVSPATLAIISMPMYSMGFDFSPRRKEQVLTKAGLMKHNSSTQGFKPTSRPAKSNPKLEKISYPC